MPAPHTFPKAELKAIQGIPMRIGDRPFVAVPAEVLRDLMAKGAAAHDSGGLPPASVEAGSYMRNLIASDLRAARAAAGLTQGQLATGMKISQTRVSMAESAVEKVSLAFVKRWLAACSLPGDWKPQDEVPSRPVRAPNTASRKAIAELEAGKGTRFKSVQDLMADLDEDD